jgi:hypothetical protein
LAILSRSRRGVVRQFERRHDLYGPSHDAGGRFGQDARGPTGGDPGDEAEGEGHLACDAQRRDPRSQLGGARPLCIRTPGSARRGTGAEWCEGRHRRQSSAFGGAAIQQCGKLRRRHRGLTVGHHPHVVDDPGEGRDVLTNGLAAQHPLDGGVEPGAREHVGEAIVAACHRVTPSCARRRAIVA